MCVLLLVTFVACYPSHMHGLRGWVQVPFGKVVTCPTCKTTLAVVQPQQGVQVCSAHKKFHLCGCLLWLKFLRIAYGFTPQIAR